ncbi:hypothetical protein SAMN05660909_01515 [Chitinophaga terrae (ex Kim and Jung 2007)]|jgi:hypothetical protein|uniref:Uncharacterized protein n=1 Tax=Chitinophaga terrae (ex Kim and Jung 2007) TaxID=408074 RepID=A0A1H4A851_9BACT|nr:hypothetical protein [Chitinophaga terrae (ex Kim and Jung 2007)]SEA31851.1 hypothetical protein SAMN05660909_01515 [Chitinophaga terrae (ex Kim and Jung 2007)]
MKFAEIYDIFEKNRITINTVFEIVLIIKYLESLGYSNFYENHLFYTMS